MKIYFIIVFSFKIETNLFIINNNNIIKTMATVINGNHDNTNGTTKDSKIIMDSKKRKVFTDVNCNEILETNGHHEKNGKLQSENGTSQNGHKSAKYDPIKKCGPVDLADVLVKRHALVG